MSRMYRDDDAVQQIVDDFLRNMPDSLEGIYEKIPQEKLVTYQSSVLAETLSQVKEYLGET